MLLQRDDAIDLVVPRGGERLIRHVVDVSRIPVVKLDKGVCSAYVHASADLSMASEIILNGKVQRPGVCNAIENVLIDRSLAEAYLPALCDLLQAAGVTIRLAPDIHALAPQHDIANDDDWHTEYLDLVLSIAAVDGVDAAVSC